MAYRIDDYAKIVDQEVIFEIFKAARLLCGKSIVHINSTYYGGGVAEMLSALVPLMNDTGAETGWRQLRGSPDFFNITKKFHNALQGDDINLTEMKKSSTLRRMRISQPTPILTTTALLFTTHSLSPLLSSIRKSSPGYGVSMLTYHIQMQICGISLRTIF